MNGIDRSQWANLDPQTKRAILGSAHAEIGDQFARNPQIAQAYLETVFNRAAARGMTPLQVVTDRHYYPQTTLRRMQGVPDATLARYEPHLQAVLQGSNIANYATGNASGTVGFAGGPHTFQAPGTYERFGIEKPDTMWARQVSQGQAYQAPQYAGEAPVWNGAPVGRGSFEGATTGGNSMPQYHPGGGATDIASGLTSAGQSIASGLQVAAAKNGWTSPLDWLGGSHTFDAPMKLGGPAAQPPAQAAPIPTPAAAPPSTWNGSAIPAHRFQGRNLMDFTNPDAYSQQNKQRSLVSFNPNEQAAGAQAGPSMGPPPGPQGPNPAANQRMGLGAGSQPFSPPGGPASAPPPSGASYNMNQPAPTSHSAYMSGLNNISTSLNSGMPQTPTQQSQYGPGSPAPSGQINATQAQPQTAVGPGTHSNFAPIGQSSMRFDGNPSMSGASTTQPGYQGSGGATNDAANSFGQYQPAQANQQPASPTGPGTDGAMRGAAQSHSQGGMGASSPQPRDSGYRSASWLNDASQFGDQYANWKNPGDGVTASMDPNKMPQGKGGPGMMPPGGAQGMGINPVKNFLGAIGLG